MSSTYPNVYSLINTFINSNKSISQAAYDAGEYFSQSEPTMEQTSKFYGDLLKLGKDLITTYADASGALSEQAKEKIGVANNGLALIELEADFSNVIEAFAKGDGEYKKKQPRFCMLYRPMQISSNLPQSLVWA